MSAVLFNMGTPPSRVRESPKAGGAHEDFVGGNQKQIIKPRFRDSSRSASDVNLIGSIDLILKGSMMVFIGNPPVTHVREVGCVTKYSKGLILSMVHLDIRGKQYYFEKDPSPLSRSSVPTRKRHTPEHLGALMYEALRKGATVDDLYKKTYIKPWFIQQMEELVELEEQILQYKGRELPDQMLIQAKKDGFLLLLSPTRKRGESWQVVSGALEAEETIMDGLLRESREELGSDLRVRPLGSVHVETFKYDDSVQYMIGIYYLLAYEGGEVHPGDDMLGSHYRWWSMDELADERVIVDVPPDQKWIFERAIELYRLWRDRTEDLQPGYT